MKEINKMTSREAMNLPSIYKSGVLEETEYSFEEIRHESFDELTKIVNSVESTLSSRWAAGTLLGLLKDPRIEVFNPEMVIVPSANITVGEDLNKLEEVYKRYKKIGVKYEWLLKEYPKHIVNIPNFKISKYLITNYEYFIFLKDSHHNDIPTSWKFGMYDSAKSNHPVYGILPESADKYAGWLSNKTNRNFRLPTEYEWEYSAAGSEGREYPWGQHFDANKANTLELGIYSTTPVGIFPEGASPFGCLDMAGNAEEYVSNNYFVYPNGKFIQDDLISESNYRIARGGSFTRYSDLARCKRRHGFYRNEIYIIGFRLVEDIN